jgi:hypothetical protein
MFIIDDLLLAPFRFVLFIAEEIKNHVEAELTDETVIRQKLLELQIRLEEEEIDPEEYAEKEAALIERLHLAQAAKLLQEEEERE